MYGFYCRITLEENKHFYGQTSILIKMLAKRLIVIFKKIATFTSKLLANFFETEGNFAKLTSRAEYERRVVKAIVEPQARIFNESHYFYTMNIFGFKSHFK